MSKKVALVTGATRGIGKAIALELVAKGYYVLGTATSDAGAQTISDFLADNGKGLKLDVSNQEELKAFIANVNKEHGGVDVLVNNAGITKDNLFLRLNSADFDAVLKVNLYSVFELSSGFVRGMLKKGWGRIVNVGSVIGSTGNAGQANYAASKAAVVGYTKSLAAEVAAKGVTVNVVAPGFIATDMTDVLSDAVKEGILAKVPAKRMGSPEDVAKAVAFLASDDAGYITGSTLHVNGGLYGN